MPFKPQTSKTLHPKLRELEITLRKTTEADHPEGPTSVFYRFTAVDQNGHPMDHDHGPLQDVMPTIAEQLLNRLDTVWNQIQGDAFPGQAPP